MNWRYDSIGFAADAAADVGFYFSLFPFTPLAFLVLVVLVVLFAFWQCCLMLMSAIECGASVIFRIFPQLVLPLPRF